MPTPVLRPAALAPATFLAVAVAVAFLAVAAGATTPPLVGPEPPPAFRGPDAIAQPLDRRLAEDPLGVLSAPDEWCPAGEDFQRWLVQRLPGARRSSRAKAHGEPDITWTGGVVVMEDHAGTLLRHDRRPDLQGLSLEWIPSGDDYVAGPVPPAYDPDVGAQVLVNERGHASAQVDLAMTSFPFGGVARDRMWVTSAFTIAFTDPAAPGPAQLRLPDVVADRSPRIAPLAQGTSLGGWNAFVREAADRVVVTWRASEGAGYDVDVQVILHADGRITMTWARLVGVLHGSVVIIDGDDAWWNERVVGGSILSAPDEVTVPPPDGPAADLIEVRAVQVGGSEILQIELHTQAPLPADTDGTLQYVVEIRDGPGEPVLAAYWFEWQDGRFNWAYAPTEMLPSGFRFSINRSAFDLVDDDIEVVVWTATSWSWQQYVVGMVGWPSAPPVPLMRDWSAIGSEPLRGPLVESFTIPELDVYAVAGAYARHFGHPPLDAMAIYQNILTDIVFWAGAYSTVGNAGADGIGAGNSADPPSPALLHMNALGYGWNSWDAGKVTVLNHELGHRWLYFYRMMEDGVATRSCGEGHPAGWTHVPAVAPVYTATDASCMGGSDWTDHADGTFTSAPSFASYGYSWHELYLMGLADPAEVPDWWYLRDSVPALPGAYWPPENLTVSATRVDVTLQQVIDAMGPRFPDRAGSPSDFLVPMVLVVRPGEWTQADVDEVARTCATWRPMFHVATGERATVTCDRIGDRPPSVQIVEPPEDLVIDEGTTLSFRGAGFDADLDDVTLTWDFELLGPAASGEGPHDVTFPEPGEHVVILSGVDATGRPAEPAMRRISVRCVAPDEMPLLDVGRRPDGALSFSVRAGAPPADEHVLGEALVLPGSFTEAASGSLPLVVPEPPGLRFYRLAGRNHPDCLGPW